MIAGGVVTAVLTAFALFAVTNADDIVVLTILNVTSRVSGRPRGWQIWAGQCAGFAVLIAVSLAVAGGLFLVPAHWLWLLGLLPLGMGVYKLAVASRARRTGQPASPAVVTGLTGVIGLTIVNGGDNVSVYTPVFRTSGLAEIMLTIAVFMAGTALYCLAGSRFAANHAVNKFIERWGQWIVPAVFILIGLYIFHKTGLLRQARPGPDTGCPGATPSTRPRRCPR
jgi:cadmium resistance protein CadD (predicted permease)